MLALAAPAAAQVVRVRLVEEDGAKAVPGALVSLERDGVRTSQALSDGGGRAVLRGTGAGGYRVRADRIGYAGTFSEAFRAAAADTVSLTIVMPGTRVMLPEITVNSKAVCALDREEGTALAALWSEVKKALAGASLTERLAPPELEVTTFEREFDRRSQIRQERSNTTRRRGARPFVTVEPARLLERGFVEEREGETWYSAPDADLLLSDAFLSQHCFKVVPGPKDDSTLVGLAFEPTRGRKVPEVAGTLWLDKSTSELTVLDYRYVNLERRLSRGTEGGRLEFERLPSGGWIVGDWVIRMPVVARVRGRAFDGRPEERDSLLGMRESGGRAEVIDALRPAPTRSVLVGTVFDSTAGAPLEGARVSIAGGGYAATTDAQGKFRIETPTRGNFLISVEHPRVQLMQTGPLQGSARLDRGTVATADLAIPSLARLRPALCGAETPDSATTAIVVGFVRDSLGAPLPFGRLAAQLREFGLKGDGPRVLVTANSRNVAVQADGNGVYRICGVPRENRLWLAGTAGFVPAVTMVPIGAEVVAVRDITLLPGTRRAGDAVLRVAVTAAEGGRPVEGALVTLLPGSDTTRMDASGKGVVAGLPEGHHLLEVKALGFEAQQRVVEVSRRDTTTVALALAPSAQMLTTLEVAADAPRRVHPMMAGFEERRKEGLGHYFTLEQLQSRPQSTVSDVVRMSPGIRLVPRPSPCNGYAAAGSRTQSGLPRYCQGVPMLDACYFAVFVDGMNIWNARLSEPPPDLNEFRVDDLEGIEVYAGPAQLPAQYHLSGADCGAVLIWHRVSAP
ncbi:MAG: carboxypeptidase regulatory-like domain-containing protein [Gemmatimonadales bacterium]